jgi:hypothetical protein
VTILAPHGLIRSIWKKVTTERVLLTSTFCMMVTFEVFFRVPMDLLPV